MIVAALSATADPLQRFDQNLFTKRFETIDRFNQFYLSHRDNDVVLVAFVRDVEELAQLNRIPFLSNIYVVILGPPDMRLSLEAGKLGADAYLTEDDTDDHKLRETILAARPFIKARGGPASRLILFAGTNGGSGTTTISMNAASLLASRSANRKVVFVDLNHAKSVTSLFFDCHDPKKTVVDVASENTGTDEELIRAVIRKCSNNFYFLPGIQDYRHRDMLEKPEGVKKVIGFLQFLRRFYDYVIVDAGLFEGTRLQMEASDTADDIYLIGDFSIPSISMVVTDLDVAYVNGWALKTSLIWNRYDSQGALKKSEIEKFLAKQGKVRFEIQTTLPNDSAKLRYSWNEARLVTELYPDTIFVKALSEFVAMRLAPKENIHNTEFKIQAHGLDGQETGATKHGQSIRAFLSRISNTFIDGKERGRS